MLKWLKRLVLFFVISLFFLLLIAIINTYTTPSKQVTATEKPFLLKQNDSLYYRLSEAIRIRTISYSDPSKIDTNEFIRLHLFLKNSFPLVHQKLKLEKVNKYSLLYTWEGKEKDLQPYLLMAHQDVVPADDSTLWEQSPFSGAIANGYIYGRGTLDIKSGILAILESVEYLLKEGYQPKETIYLAFGQDEENEGTGAKAIAGLLKERGIKLSFVLDEGGLILNKALPGLNGPTALIGIAEKGFINVKIKAKGIGGHSSMPHKESSVTKLAESIHKIQENPFPAYLQGPAKKMFEYTAPEMQFPFNVLFGNQWLFGKLILTQMSKMPSSNAAIRTTIAVNMLQGSSKENVVPSEASAIANLRTMPGTTPEFVKSYLEEVVDDKDVTIEIKPNFKNPSKISSTDTEGFKRIQRTVSQIFPSAISAPFQLVAITDSRHYADIAENIYRFHPAFYEKHDIERLHGRNERISEKNYVETINFYYNFIKE